VCRRHANMSERAALTGFSSVSNDFSARDNSVAVYVDDSFGGHVDDD